MTAPGNRPFCLPQTEVRTVMATAGEREYRAFIAEPSEPAPPGGFPVVYLLDANATFATLVEAIRVRGHRPASTGVVPGIVVGVGYPVDGPYDRERRTFDFTPGPASLPTARPGTGVAGPTGGGRQFLDFLDTLRSDIESDYPIDQTRRVLVGHSLGGLLVVQALFDRFTDYQSYVAISPSLWWNWDELLNRATSFESPVREQTATRNVFLAVGEFEEAVAPWQEGSPGLAEMRLRRAERAMVRRTREFAGVLRDSAPPGLRVEFAELPNEDHASVVPAALSRALRLVLGPR